MKIFVKVIPNSKKSEVINLGNDHFKVKVDAAAEDGKANKRLIKILAEYFNIPKSNLLITKGMKSREKIIILHTESKY